MEKNMKCNKCKKPISPEDYVGKIICKNCDKEHLTKVKKMVRGFYKKYTKKENYFLRM